MKKSIDLSKIPFTPVVRAGDFLFVSGQIGIVDGQLVEGGIEAEIRQAIQNLSDRLESMGATLRDVIKTTVMLRHYSEHFGTLNALYAEAFGMPYPARTAFGVADLPLGALVEIEVVAYLPNPD